MSFAEREKFRPQVKNKLLLLLALLMTAATGAWAQKGDTSWTSGDCTVTLSGGTLTISKTSGNGAMADYTGGFNSQPWAGSKTQITSVVVQSGVTKIGKYSFYQFTNIQSVSLPAGLQTIGEAAFKGITNTNFTSVTIPSSVTTIGNNAFDGCNKLTSVTLPASLTNNGAGRYVFKGCTSLTSVTIPDGVESIGMYYFQNCTSLASITIPASVKNIGMQAFDGCTSLATVTINGSPYIPSNAFPAGVSATINLTANGPVDGKYWTTFHNAGFNFQADENTQVFKVALSGTTLTMNEVDNGIVDAGTAVVLKTTSENIAMTSTTSTSSDEQTNNLIGVTATAGKSSDGTFYVLDNGASGLGFYKLASGNKVGTGKAYLTSDSESDFFSIGGGSGSEEPSTYTVSFAENTEDATSWQGKAGEGEYQALPLEGVAAGTAVSVKYNGTKKVKSVKAVKKATTSSLLSAATKDDIGKVVCAAGHLHDAKTAVPDGCTAVGILGKVTSTGHGLILALKDAAQQSWNTINSWTSASYAGTTLKVLPDDAARGTNLTSYTTLGETAVSNWAVAQKSDYEAIFTNLGSTTGDSDGNTYDGKVNAYITTGVGGTAIAIDGHYRSATEKGGGSAWGFDKSFWSGYEVQFEYSVRPVLGF